MLVFAKLEKAHCFVPVYGLVCISKRKPMESHLSVVFEVIFLYGVAQWLVPPTFHASPLQFILVST
jgi:hypothetical protein